MAAPIRIVWLEDRFPQSDWLTSLFGDLITETVTEALWPEPRPRTLYAIDTNWHPLASIPESFLAAVRKTPGAGLFHLDEWLIEDYGVYRNFAFVVRIHQARGFDHPSILALPQGWPAGTVEGAPSRAASQRSIPWFFAGTAVSSRPAMLRAMKVIPAGEAHIPSEKAKRLAHAEYLAKIADTVFVPAPMGNIISETGRVYEGLENGAIPLLERRATLDYYRRLFGPHPLPTFSSWRQAARFAADLISRPDDLDRLQAETTAWWRSYKEALRAKAQAFLVRGADDLLRQDLAAFTFPSGWRRVAWQYSELLRHQSGTSLAYRLRKALARRSLARDMSYLQRGR
jgi:hypothetical protein